MICETVPPVRAPAAPPKGPITPQFTLTRHQATPASSRCYVETNKVPVPSPAMRSRSFQSRRRAFSLFELMLVVAIGALFAGLAIPRMGAANARYQADY